MNPYIDKSDNEYSIHCLSKIDIELITEGIFLVFNELPKENKHKEAKKRLIRLKNILENEQ